MRPQYCEHCPTVGTRLEALSEYAWVNYYRCPNGHVWQIAKDASQEREDVTERPVRVVSPRDAAVAC